MICVSDVRAEAAGDCPGRPRTSPSLDSRPAYARRQHAAEPDTEDDGPHHRGPDRSIVRRHSSRGWTPAPPPRTSRSTRCCSRARRPTPPGPGPRRGRRADRVLQEDGLQKLAQATRGDVFRIMSNSDFAFQRLANELSGYYLLGFEPDAGDRNGRPHDITVAVKRDGVTVRSRRQFTIDGSTVATRRERDRRRAARSAAGGRHPDQARRLLVP